MAVSAENLVQIDLDPVMTLDPTLADAIPARVEAEMAVQGWTLADMTDQRSVFVALLVTRSLVSRLLLKFSQEIKKTAGGSAQVEFNDAIKYLQALQAELDQRRIETMFIANPTSIVTTDKWPSSGVLSI
jgi:hypothetical protein